MSIEFLESERLLEPENMLHLYSLGAFPMAEKKDSATVDWFMPETRTIILLDAFNIPRSLKKTLNSGIFEVQYDNETMNVIRRCADRESTWISGRLIRAYKSLFDLGFLHSVEVYQAGALCGGLYGVAIRGAFFGESMFSLTPQASKVALVNLVQRLQEKGFTFLDVQYETEHLKMFGTKTISFEGYKQMLDEAFENSPEF